MSDAVTSAEPSATAEPPATPAEPPATPAEPTTPSVIEAISNTTIVSTSQPEIIDMVVNPDFIDDMPVSLFFRLFRRYAEEILLPCGSYHIRRGYLLFGYIYTVDGRLCLGVYVDDPSPSVDYGMRPWDMDEFNPDLIYFWFLPECILGRYRHPEPPNDEAIDDDTRCCQCCICVE